ncbi:gamma-glutamyltransferase [Micromonospora lutea]|uniref:Glutathione hydrolase proenzyme n=1 Tax=Micromonospora lutea TaxID=419825 RepID=A0ABQ4J2M2_9ACTN|nr:gamma-glutamyltransferase [Micromonospora lutea]GIJ24245.1 gamma-glutamyltranspeptidase [Micromonospora lutea]
MTSANGPATGRPAARAERGMVSAPHQLASSAGLHALRRGGSAADAAIAANAVLCVVYPHMAGLGGDAFALIRPPGRPVEALNAAGPAGSKATREHYERAGHTEEIPSRGPLAALTVPGAVDGWRQAHERHGRLPWGELFDDAIHLARSGFPVSRSLAQWLPQDAAMLRQDPGASSIFLPGGRVPREGDRLVNPDLARAFEAIARRGAREGFYEGELAQRLCHVAESPLVPEDFAGFTASWVAPIETTYRGLTVLEFPPSTQGFAALQMLNILEGYDVAGWGDLSVEYVHHATEAVKLAFADRDAWLTDPKHHDIPLDRLLAKDYADERRRRIDPTAALDAVALDSGVPGGWTGVRPVPAGDTCYLAAVDADGMVVSFIESIYHDFGSGVVPEGTGILLQNRGSFFSLDEEHHNRLDPDKHTFHTLMPGMVLREDGSPYAALGTMGGEGQPQTQVAMLTRMVDFGYDVQQAIEAPRWLMGRTWGAESRDLWLEGRIPDPVVHELERLGQPVRMLPDWDDNLGHAHAIRIHPDGFLEGGADPRGDGAALGF